MKTWTQEKLNKTPEEQIAIAKIKIMFEDSFGIFNAKSGYMSKINRERERDNAIRWLSSKDCEFFCELAGTEQKYILKLHEILTYKYNSDKITLDEVKFAIRKLELTL